MMRIPSLGMLAQVPVREAWRDEARVFSPWLAEHLDLLAEVIGIPLELTGREVAVDNFSADILARNPLDDSVVLIENQLEWTDHSHLGQIMTYLAGLHAQTVIWIAADFQEAHLSAVNWLNEHTVDPFAFFAVKVRAVRIGDSPIAPVFEVLSRPSGWDRQLQAIATEQTTSEIGRFRQAFWTHFLERHADATVDGPAGLDSNRRRVFASMDLVISSYIAQDGVGLFIRGRRNASNQEVYETLLPHAAHLAERTGAELGTPDRPHFFVSSYRADTSDRARWDELADWLHERLTLYTTALQEIG